jgi:hypothetical protein
MTLAKQGRAFMDAHPNCRPVDLVENCGFSLPYAKAFLNEEYRKIFNANHLKTRINQKLTMLQEPREIKPEPAVKPPPVVTPAAEASPSTDWKENYRLALAHIQKLEKHIGEHKAVIAYLEQFIEKRYGSSV